MIRTFCLLIASLFFAMLAPAAAADISLPQVLVDAMRVLPEKTGPADAIAIVNQYIAANPNDGKGYAVRCSATSLALERARKNSKTALSDCQKAIQLSPKSTFAHLVYADILYDSGSLSDSIPQYSAAIDLGLTTHGVFRKRCDAYRRTGKLDAALQDCQRQVALTPGDFASQLALGMIQIARSNNSTAVATLNCAIHLNPNNILVLYWRGIAYARLDKNAEADADFSAALAQGDQSPDTYYERGLVREKLGRTAAAIADIILAGVMYERDGLTKQAATARAALATLQGAPPVQPTPDTRGMDYTFTAADMRQLIKGYQAALSDKNSNVTLSISELSPVKMPAYNPTWNLTNATLDASGKAHISITFATTLGKRKFADAITHGLLLGLAASGYAGPHFKKAYDNMLTADTSLGANAPDPFLNRRKLANILVQIFNKLKDESK